MLANIATFADPNIDVWNTIIMIKDIILTDWLQVIVMAFLTTINGPGGAPEFDLASATDECTSIEGTGLKKCPQVE